MFYVLQSWNGLIGSFKVHYKRALLVISNKHQLLPPSKQTWASAPTGYEWPQTEFSPTDDIFCLLNFLPSLPVVYWKSINLQIPDVLQSELSPSLTTLHTIMSSWKVCFEIILSFSVDPSESPNKISMLLYFYYMSCTSHALLSILKTIF